MMLRSLLLTSLIAVCSAQNLDLTQKNVSQSSTFKENSITYSADRAVDGNNTTCSHTDCQPNSWWRIDLLGVYQISSVTIYNKAADNWNITGAQIHVSYSLKGNGTANSTRLNITNFKKGHYEKYSFTQNASGRYITVFLSEHKYMILCDVHITGKIKDSPFELIKESKTWEQALEHCRDKDMELATIINEETQAWAELAAMEATTSYVWLGLRYTCTLSFWFWITDHTVEFDRWGPNRSITNNCDESAAMSRENYFWVPKHDEEMYNFICSEDSFW